MGIKFFGIVLQVNVHRLTESDFWYDVILSRWQPWHLPSDHCCICICPLVCRVLVVSLAGRVHYSFSSVAHSYLFRYISSFY